MRTGSAGFAPANGTMINEPAGLVSGVMITEPDGLTSGRMATGVELSSTGCGGRHICADRVRLSIGDEDNSGTGGGAAEGRSAAESCCCGGAPSEGGEADNADVDAGAGVSVGASICDACGDAFVDDVEDEGGESSTADRGEEFGVPVGVMSGVVDAPVELEDMKAEMAAAEVDVDVVGAEGARSPSGAARMTLGESSAAVRTALGEPPSGEAPAARTGGGRVGLRGTTTLPLFTVSAAEGAAEADAVVDEAAFTAGVCCEASTGPSAGAVLAGESRFSKGVGDARARNAFMESFGVACGPGGSGRVM